MEYAIGVDIGATNIKMLAVKPSGDVMAEIREATDDRSPAWREKVKDLVGQLQTQRGWPATWVGIAAPGLAAPDNRSICFMPGRLAGLEGLDWTDFLARKQTVPVLNDAHAALIGENWKGAAQGFKDVILLTLGTGVGGAIMIGGRLLQGGIGRAGHFGHICLDTEGAPDITSIPGSLEDAVGECSLARRSKNRYVTTQQLLEDFLAGDATANSIWRKSLHELACAIASLINILDPEAVIIGGGISQAGEALFGPLNRCLDRVEWRPGDRRVPILAARLGDLPGALGAARYAMIHSRNSSHDASA